MRCNFLNILISFAACWKRKAESSAFPGLPFSPYPATMLGYDLFHQGQTYPRTFKFFCVMQSLEYPEQLVRVLIIKAHAIILYTKSKLPFVHKMADLDTGRFLVPGIFNGVGNKVYPHLPDRMYI